MVMELICYLQPGWAPLIRPAPATRPWMDQTPEAFAYRCLPLNIANAHGWEVLNPCGFEAVWSGESDPAAISIRLDPGADPGRAPVSLFGQGVITFHIEGLFRTPPGWNIWVGGSPNRSKDGIQALSGIVEADWSPFTFTMNWRFTRPDEWVRFEPMEPIAFFFPVERGAIEAFRPRFEPIDSDPRSREGFAAWSRARDAFHQQMRHNAPATGSEKWQKHYYRGVDVDGRAWIDDHQAKLRLAPFDTSATPQAPVAPLKDGRVASGRAPSLSRAARDLAKREWLLEAAERQRALSPRASAVERIAGMSGEHFLDHYYAPCRPVILAREMAAWPALSRWSPDYLKAVIGARQIEFQGAHRTLAPFDAFIDRITAPGAGADAYLTAYNSAANAEALGPLHADLGVLEKFLTPDAARGMLWIGPAGTFTPLHHDLTNNLIAQIVGRKRVLIGPASEVGRLYNDAHVFSEIGDLEDPGLDRARFSRLEGSRIYAVTLEPGDILFLPFAWWRQVRALDFSVTATYANFRWANEAYKTFPAD
jgi:hypothetical protein